MTDTDRAILDVEAKLWRYAATKEQHVRDMLGLAPTRYYQRLARLIDDPEAVAYAPATIRRLRARRERARRRSPAEPAPASC